MLLDTDNLQEANKLPMQPYNAYSYSLTMLIALQCLQPYNAIVII